MINNFNGGYSFLSNSFESPFWYKGMHWKTVEHAFQAAKCLNQADFDRVFMADTPDEAKRIGCKATLIPRWDYKKDDVMRDCLRMKFLQNDELMQKLLVTGDELLVEDNATNMLGQLLMELRDNYRNGNFIWIVRDLQNFGEIVEHYKTREGAMAMIKRQYERDDEVVDNPYEYDGYRIDVICMKD